jgi:hypothetical protein
MANEAPPVGAWLEERLQRAAASVEALTREVAHLHRGLAAREQEAVELREALAIIDGRTLRHEASQEIARELSQAVAAVEERVAEEATFRREQAAASDRAQQRAQHAERTLEQALFGLQARVAEVERQAVAAIERQAALNSDVATTQARDAGLARDVEALAARVDALTQLTRRDTGDGSRFVETSDSLTRRLLAAETRLSDLLQDQRRLGDEVTALGRLAEREESLADLLEQHRVLRQRVESGLATLQERTSAAEETQFAETEEARLTRSRLDALERRLDVLAKQFSGQQEALLKHFRRMNATAEDAGRRQADEIDRQARAARELLVRLAENAAEVTQEPPL